MKRVFRVFLAIGGLVLVLFLLGPQPSREISVRFDPATLDEDLETYLQMSELAVPNLKPGAEKEIVWADPVGKSKTPVSVIYIHGFSASKHEIRPVPDNVAKALGANLFFTRMTGHGRDGQGMGEATLQDWGDDFAEAIRIGERLGDKVLVLATSNGGAVTTWGLSNPELSENVMGVAFFSPAYELLDLPTWFANIPWAETILPAIAGEERSWEPRNEQQGKWWTTSYPSKALFPMTSLLRVVKDIDASTISVPSLFAYSPGDQVVSPTEIEAMAASWGGPVEVLKIEEVTDPYRHVITGDIMAPETTEMVSRTVTDWARSLAR